MKLRCLFCRNELPVVKNYNGGVYCSVCKSAFLVEVRGGKVRQFYYDGNTHFTYGELIKLHGQRNIYELNKL